jgi:hypothetical protein
MSLKDFPCVESNAITAFFSVESCFLPDPFGLSKAKEI